MKSTQVLEQKTTGVFRSIGGKNDYWTGSLLNTALEESNDT